MSVLYSGEHQLNKIRREREFGCFKAASSFFVYNVVACWDNFGSKNKPWCLALTPGGSVYLAWVWPRAFGGSKDNPSDAGPELRLWLRNSSGSGIDKSPGGRLGLAESLWIEAGCYPGCRGSASWTFPWGLTKRAGAQGDPGSFGREETMVLAPTFFVIETSLRGQKRPLRIPERVMREGGCEAAFIAAMIKKAADCSQILLLKVILSACCSVSGPKSVASSDWRAHQGGTGWESISSPLENWIVGWRNPADVHLSSS